jgi:hypothetical protein
MDDYAGSAWWQELFESALRAYEKKTGVVLAEHPLTLQLQSCHSAEDITALLQDRARAFNDFRERDRIMDSTETIVSILNPLSDPTSLADSVDLVRQKALMECFTSPIFFLSDFISTCEGNTS